MPGTLVLNASFEPLGLVDVKRAIVLVLADKATVVEASEVTLRSERLSLETPSVIRLTRFVRVPYRARAPFTKRGVLIRDGYRCAYCGKSGARTVDHVVPRALNGQDSWENCVAACRRCNGKKGSKTLAELGWTLRVTPSAPSGHVALVIAYTSADPTWEPYLTGWANPQKAPVPAM